MKAKTIIAAIVLLLATNIVSYFVGSHEIFMASDVREDGSRTIKYPHCFSIREAWKYEASYAGALLEGLHRFYSNDDNDFWFDVFMQTPEYQRIDSINGGDWEDCYYYETPILDYQDYQ